MEPAALARAAFEIELPAHYRDQLATDRQSQPGATVVAGAVVLRLDEGFENLLLQLRRDPLAGIDDFEAAIDMPVSGFAADTQRDRASARRELDGVEQQIQQHLRQSLPIAVEALAANLVADERQLHASRFGLRHHHAFDILDQPPELKAAFVQLQRLEFEPRQVEYAVDQSQHVARGDLLAIQVFALLIGQRRLPQQRAGRDHGVHRGAQLVAHGGEEAILDLAAHALPLDRIGQAAAFARLTDRQRQRGNDDTRLAQQHEQAIELGRSQPAHVGERVEEGRDDEHEGGDKRLSQSSVTAPGGPGGEYQQHRQENEDQRVEQPRRQPAGQRQRQYHAPLHPHKQRLEHPRRAPADPPPVVQTGQQHQQQPCGVEPARRIVEEGQRREEVAVTIKNQQQHAEKQRQHQIVAIPGADREKEVVERQNQQRGEHHAVEEVIAQGMPEERLLAHQKQRQPQYFIAIAGPQVEIHRLSRRNGEPPDR